MIYLQANGREDEGFIDTGSELTIIPCNSVEGFTLPGNFPQVRYYRELHDNNSRQKLMHP